MKTIMLTVPAHFDGTHIQLDVDVEIKPDTRLLVTILSEEAVDEALLLAVMQSSESAFAQVWDNEENAVYDEL